MFKYEWGASVRVLTDALIYWYGSEKGDSQLFSYFSPAPGLKYVGFGPALWTDKAAHVFHYAYYWHSNLTCKKSRLLNNNLGYLGRNGNYHHTVHFGQKLSNAERLITSARRQVYEQNVQVSPNDV